MRRSALSLLLLSMVAIPALAGPRAVPIEPIHDFDVVAKGEVLVHDFEIRNDGDQPLMIENVRPACGCAVAKFDKSIPPGKIGRIHAEVDTLDFFGPISKSIAVYTNDVENPKLQLVVRAKVMAYISAEPSYARFLYVQQEPVQPVQQLIWAEDDHPLDVVDVKTDSQKIFVDYRPARADERREGVEGPQWIVNVNLRDNAQVGPLREEVKVITNHPKQRSAVIPVSGFVRPRQHITPMEVDFGPLQGDALPLRRSLAFTNFITDRIRVTKIDTGIEGLSAEVTDSEERPGHRFRLLLELGPDLPRGEFDTVIRIHTSDAKNPVIELPVKGVVI
ncbi:MAG: DUF1573 domain-containing protein [Thermoanaerobaculia bacterium]|nr:DUF1573 domain-containing protein [Thermoanaerobaculia bacterium]